MKFGWPEKQLKRFLYKKYLLKNDVEMAIRDNNIDRALRIVPKHSKDIFIKELLRKKPELLESCICVRRE